MSDNQPPPYPGEPSGQEPEQPTPGEPGPAEQTPPGQPYGAPQQPQQPYGAQPPPQAFGADLRQPTRFACRNVSLTPIAETTTSL